MRAKKIATSIMAILLAIMPLLPMSSHAAFEGSWESANKPEQVDISGSLDYYEQAPAAMQSIAPMSAPLPNTIWFEGREYGVGQINGFIFLMRADRTHRYNPPELLLPNHYRNDNSTWQPSTYNGWTLAGAFPPGGGVYRTGSDEHWYDVYRVTTTMYKGGVKTGLNFPAYNEGGGYVTNHTYHTQDYLGVSIQTKSTYRESHNWDGDNFEDRWQYVLDMETVTSNNPVVFRFDYNVNYFYDGEIATILVAKDWTALQDGLGLYNPPTVNSWHNPSDNTVSVAVTGADGTTNMQLLRSDNSVVSSVNSRSTVFTVTTNGAYKVQATNGSITRTVDVSVTQLDNSPPNMTYTPLSTAWGKTASTTITLSDATTAGLQYYHNGSWRTYSSSTVITFGSNGNYTIYYKDKWGNQSSKVIAVSKVDTTAPTITRIDGNPTSWTGGNVTLSVIATDTQSGLHPQAYSFDNGVTWQASNSKTFSGNQTVNVKARDTLGNISATQSATISKVDKTAPLITAIEGNSTGWTANDVTLTVTATDTQSGLHPQAYSFDNGVTWQAANSKTFGSNQSVFIKVRDAVGNITAAQSVVIDKIDKAAPIISKVDINPTGWTAGDVTLTVTATDAASGLHATAYSFDDGATWQAANSRIFNGNQTVNVRVRDALGNTTDAYPVTIDKIDTTPPIITDIEGNPTDWTADDVTLTVTATDAGSGLHAQAYSFDDGVTWQADNHMTFSSNQTVTIKVRDAVGNISLAQAVEIDKIDKTKPVIASIEGNPADWTAEDVTLTVTAEDAASGLHAQAYSFDNGVTWQADNHKTFSSNKTVIVMARDIVGNISLAQTVEIDKIDKTKPEITSIEGTPADWTAEDVTLTVTASDAGSGLHAQAYSFDNGVTWQADNHKTFSNNQTVTIKARDAVGNISDPQVVEINKIDKTKPEITSIVGNPTDWTAEDVTLTVIAVDAGSGLQAQAYSFDDGATWQADNHKTFSSNQTVAIKVRDAVDNISDPQVIEIDKIDKTKPEIASIEGNPTDWTADDITLTVTAIDTAAGLHATAYSFDDGLTWQDTNFKTYTSNQTITVKVRDAVGNISDPQVVKIDKIDKIKPEITSIDGNPTDWTPNDVTLTVTAADAASGLHAQAYSFDDGATWQEDNQMTFSSNQTVTIKARDAVGNISDLQVVEIDKIDQNPPVVDEIEGNPTDWTTDNVTLSIIAADTQSDLHAEAYSFDDGATWQLDNHKTFDSNQAVIIRVRDAVGNVSPGHMVVISKIDTTSPTITAIEGNPKDWTAENATITVTADDTASGLHAEAYSFDGGLTWQADSHKTFINNQTVNIQVRDAVGNLSPVHTVEITKVDKALPVPPKDDPSSLPSIPGEDAIIPPDDKELEWVDEPKSIEATASALSGIKMYQYQVEQVNLPAADPQPVQTRSMLFGSLRTLTSPQKKESWIDSPNGEVSVIDEGVYKVKLRAISNAGNVSPTSTYTVRNDFSAPVISHDLNGHHLTLNAQDTLSGIAKMTISYDNEISEYQAEQVTLANVRSGDYIITAVDIAGNAQVYTANVPADDDEDAPPMMVIVDKPIIIKPTPPVAIPKPPTASSEPPVSSEKDNTDGQHEEGNASDPTPVDQPVEQKANPSILRCILSLWWLWLLLLLVAYIIYKRITQNKRAD